MEPATIAGVDWADAFVCCNGPASVCRRKQSGRRRCGGRWCLNSWGNDTLNWRHASVGKIGLEQPHSDGGVRRLLCGQFTWLCSRKVVRSLRRGN